MLRSEDILKGQKLEKLKQEYVDLKAVKKAQKVKIGQLETCVEKLKVSLKQQAKQAKHDQSIQI